MKIHELQTMMMQDSKLDISKLESDSVNTPYIYSKYVVLQATEKTTLKKYKKEMKVLHRNKTAYYRGDAPNSVYKEKPLNISILKSHVPKYVESDPEVMELQEKIEIQTIKLEMLEEYMKVLYQKTFHISNAIKFMKFKNGDMSG
jgi:hypothetical protein